METRTLAELTAPGDRSLRFTPLGLSLRGVLTPEEAAGFQQRSIVHVDLVSAVSAGTRSSFERLRSLHAYGVLGYDAFTVDSDLSSIVLEYCLTP